MSNDVKSQKNEFKAEVAQVLNLVVNSLYSHKEVFLRELISNAADAIDKHHHLVLSEEGYTNPENPYSIRIVPNKEENTLKIIDNGIGLSHDEAVANLGTIASSGTRAFLEQLKENQKESTQLIGQFGVGFYSAFMVAAKVVVESKKANAEEAAIRWESDAVSGYTIEEGSRTEQGTEITLHLKDEDKEYLDEWKIKEVVKKYSDYVSHPIFLPVEKQGKDEKDIKIEEEQINKVTAIWRRSKSEVKEEEYNEFYKYLSHDFDDPLAYGHYAIEGVLEYRALLFLPKKLPANYFRDESHGLKLHVKKMFVTDDCKGLLQPYMRFVRGVVDSEDLPLNVSREMLQQNPVVTKIQKQLTKKILDLLEDLAKNKKEDYENFFKEFGVAIKEGLTLDFENREKLLDLLRYRSTKSEGGSGYISLAEYVERMDEKQTEIYYVTGPSFEACQSSPHLEFFKSKGIEVLLMGDVIDEWATPAIQEYKGKKLKSITQGDIDLGDLGKEAKEEKEKADDDLKLVKDRVRAALQDQVKEVRLSVRLAESPSCLVTDDGDMNVQMEQIMKAMGKEVPTAKRILELNPNHPIIKNIKEALDKDPKDERITSWSEVLYNQALLAEGNSIKDPAAFVKQVNSLLEQVTKD